MNREIANNLSALKGDADDYTRAYQKLVKDFDTVVSQMHALNGMWTGQAHDAFLQRFEQDRIRNQNMINYIRETLEAIEYAEMEYIRCENNVAGLVDSIRV